MKLPKKVIVFLYLLPIAFLLLHKCTEKEDTQIRTTFYGTYEYSYKVGPFTKWAHCNTTAFGSNEESSCIKYGWKRIIKQEQK